jgi:hypothetical protein
VRGNGDCESGMSIALTVKHLLACGASHEAVVKAIEEIEASKRARGTERVRKHRNACNVTDVTPPSSPPMINNSTPSPTSDLAKAKSVKHPSECSFFKEFWEVFPRKIGKGAARKAFRNALNRASGEEIVAGAKRYRPKDLEFCKHPATWLNADCWLDEPDRVPQSNIVGFRKELPPEPPRKPRTAEEQAEIDARLKKLIKVKGV